MKPFTTRTEIDQTTGQRTLNSGHHGMAEDKECENKTSGAAI
jgi:hypothetical protein